MKIEAQINNDPTSQISIICKNNPDGFCRFTGPENRKPSEARLLFAIPPTDGLINIYACNGTRPETAHIAENVQYGCSDFEPLPSPERI